MGRLGKAEPRSMCHIEHCDGNLMIKAQMDVCGTVNDSHPRYQRYPALTGMSRI